MLEWWWVAVGFGWGVVLGAYAMFRFVPWALAAVSDLDARGRVVLRPPDGK